jgi:hypothetical protein
MLIVALIGHDVDESRRRLRVARLRLSAVRSNGLIGETRRVGCDTVEVDKRIVLLRTGIAPDQCWLTMEGSYRFHDSSMATVDHPGNAGRGAI